MTRHDRFSRLGIRAAAMLALTLLASCSQDEITDNDTLPEGLYPVEIASVTISGEDDVQPWGEDVPQTRAVESPDGNTTYWQWNGEILYVKFDGDNDHTGKCELYGSQEIRTVTPLYWRSKDDTETIIGYFTQPETESGNTMNISDQTDGLAYVCRSETTEKYGNDVYLNFEHQLAKVRVYVQGTGYEGDATGVTINNVPTSCTVVDGKITETSTSTGSVQMYKTSVNNAVCFEANLCPGTLAKSTNFTVTVNGTAYEISLDSDLTLTAATVNTVSLRLQKSGTVEVDLSKETGTYTISSGGTYFFYGTGTHGIKVTGGTPTICLANANISVESGNAIDITGGSPTIDIQGSINVKSSNGAGIFVASGNTVTIQSSGRSNNVLTAEAGGEAAGIGGYTTNGTGTDCGNITIKDIRLYAYGSNGNGGACPGIGGAGNGTCGTITIESSAVYAYGSTFGDNHAPAIGSAQPANGESPATPSINISGGDILYAYRGGTGYASSNSDYIGCGGSASSKRSGNISISSGKNCQIWGFTSGSNSCEKTVWYNAEGNIM